MSVEKTLELSLIHIWGRLGRPPRAVMALPARGTAGARRPFPLPCTTE